MAYKQRSNGLPFKQMGSTPARNMKDGSYSQSFEDSSVTMAKQGTSSNIKSTKDGMINTETGETYNFKTGKSTKPTKRGTPSEQKKSKPPKPRTKTTTPPLLQKTDSKVVPENTEITIAANKKAAEIAKSGNKGKKPSNSTPAELALIKNPNYQKALSLALDKQMKENPDLTGQ